MICKEGAIDIINISGNGSASYGNNTQSSFNGAANHGHNTLQHRRKSQLITFSSSSCDIKNSLSHEIILVNNDTGSGRGSILGSCSNGSGSGGANVRLSYAEEDLVIVTNGNSSSAGDRDVAVDCNSNGSASGSNGTGGVYSTSASGSAGTGFGCGIEAEIDDDVFRRRSLEVEDIDEELFDDEFETHIETSNNANDDSGGGSYEDSHALHSSINGSNRNSLEKDDDIDVDVISTDVSCYDQLLGTGCNTRNDDDENSTLIIGSENYTKLCKNGVKIGFEAGTVGGSSSNSTKGIGGSNGENGGIIYANPFLDDEGIAESGM